MLNMMNFMMRLFVRILSKKFYTTFDIDNSLTLLHYFNRAQWIERLTTSQQKIHYPTAEMRFFFARRRDGTLMDVVSCGWIVAITGELTRNQTRKAPKLKTLDLTQ